LFGTYGTIDEASGQFSEIRGGGQRTLIAIENLVKSICDRFGAVWEGFALTGDYKFAATNDIINVPSDALFNPKLWWGLYHELAHVYISNWAEEGQVNLFSEDYPQLALFLKQKFTDGLV
jgi:hypothetical protein